MDAIGTTRFAIVAPAPRHKPTTPIVDEDSEPAQQPVNMAQAAAQPADARPIARPVAATPDGPPDREHARGRRAAGIIWWLVPLVAILALLATIVAVVARQALAARSAYGDVTADLSLLRSDSRLKLDPAQLSAADAARVRSHFAMLNADLLRLNDATRLPGPSGWVVERVPALDRRYRAGRQLLQVGLMAAAAGERISGVAADTLTAYHQNGFSSELAPRTPTWLDVVNQRRADLESAFDQIDQARAMAAAIDPSLLPASAAGRLGELDIDLARLNLRPLVEQDLPALSDALGGNGTTRYLVLIQNPEEMRPSGGFPGTVAIVTFERGQLRTYEFHDIYDLNGAYVAGGHTPIPQPWPLSQYAPSGELSMLDATWWADFPTSARAELTMYASTGWPPVDGVIAIDPNVVSNLLRLTGPQTVEVDGESRVVDADNLLAEIERERQLFMSGAKTDLVHKELIAAVGEQMLTQLRGTDPQTLHEAVDILSRAAGKRDIQLYSSNSQVENLLRERAWTGSLRPDGTTPTLAVAYGNVAFGKSSRLLQTKESVTIAPIAGSARQVTLQLDLHHSGSPDNADPFYSGVQLWWVGVYLPDGSQLVSASAPAAPDPNAPNGGSYLIELQPGQSRSLRLTFEMPGSADLLLRRQPGLQPAAVVVNQPGCDTPLQRTLDADQRISLQGVCAP